jgi:hypothetical protein
MKPIQFYIATSVGAACVILSIALITMGQSNQRLAMQAQAQQTEINRGSMSQQVGTNILRDMAGVAGTNQKIKDVLVKNGYTVTPKDSNSSTGK